MKNILSFENMLTPAVITFVYWILLLAAIVSGFHIAFEGYGGFSFGKLIQGILYAVGGCIGARILCELLIVLFKINDAL